MVLSISRGFELLQMILELDNERCASENTGLQRDGLCDPTSVALDDESPTSANLENDHEFISEES